jgi:DNA gyrase subunit A
MPVSGISELGRATQGVKLIRVEDGDEIAAITKLDESEEDETPIVSAEGGELIAGDAGIAPAETETNDEGPATGDAPEASEEGTEG